jgi:hypothetical protein
MSLPHETCQLVDQALDDLLDKALLPTDWPHLRETLAALSVLGPGGSSLQ